jgi:hypothetical protein
MTYQKTLFRPYFWHGMFGVFLFSLLLIYPLLKPISVLNAQSIEELESISTASLTLDPAFPAPGETVTATFESFAMDLNLASITWKMDGVVVQQSQGGKTYTFTAGLLGSRSQLSVVATHPSGKVLSADTKLLINAVSLIWEGQTYTPPFYRGRALAGPGANSIVVAVPSVFSPNGSLYDPATLLYEWRINAGSNPFAAGIGKTSIEVVGGMRPIPARVSVIIMTPSGETLASEYIDVPITQPEVLFYEDDPLSGIQYAKALQGRNSLTSREMVLVAEPYYMSAITRTDPGLEYVWTVGGSREQNKGSVILRPEGVGEGVAQVTLVLTNKEYFMQRIRGDLSFTFSAGQTAESVGPNTTAL